MKKLKSKYAKAAEALTATSVLEHSIGQLSDILDEIHDDKFQETRKAFEALTEKFTEETIKILGDSIENHEEFSYELELV